MVKKKHTTTKEIHKREKKLIRKPPTRTRGGEEKETKQKKDLPRYAAQRPGEKRVKLNIYAVRDTKAEAFLLPFFERTNDTALRVVEKAIESDANFNAYAEDYSLWLLGEWNDNNGCVKGEVPLHLANLIDIRDKHEKKEGIQRDPQMALTEAGTG